MRVVILSNPRSGRGRAERIAAPIVGELRRRGHSVKHLIVGEPETIDPDRLASADALVVVGGDGTVNSVCDAAIAADTPIYHAASGNENLFAREFAMSRRHDHVARAVEGARMTRVDLGVCSAQSFLIMCSLGPDSGIIRRLTESRKRATGHAAYLRPVVAEALRPYIPRLSVEVDGRPFVEGRRGMVIAANSRQYAARIDPAPHARIDDGRLGVVFLPCTTSLGNGAWLAASRVRTHLRLGRALAASGERVRISVEGGPLVHQLDGEAPTGSAPQALDLSVRARVLPVLLPS